MMKEGKPVEAALLLSHFHWDHIQGLPFFVPAYVPGTKLHERVRRVTDEDGSTYYRTIKFGTGARRTEIEEETTAEIFAGLFATVT